MNILPCSCSSISATASSSLFILRMLGTQLSKWDRLSTRNYAAYLKWTPTVVCKRRAAVSGKVLKARLMESCRPTRRFHFSAVLSRMLPTNLSCLIPCPSRELGATHWRKPPTSWVELESRFVLGVAAYQPRWSFIGRTRRILYRIRGQQEQSITSRDTD